jgi:transcriptional regulator with XRE-family HTH domain
VYFGGLTQTKIAVKEYAVWTCVVGLNKIFNLEIDANRVEKEAMGKPYLQRLFAENLKRFRKRVGLTQTELSEKIGMSLTAINHLELGDTWPRIATVSALEKVLKVSAEEFFKDGSGQQTISIAQATQTLLSAVDSMQEKAIAYDSIPERVWALLKRVKSKDGWLAVEAVLTTVAEMEARSKKRD